MNHFRGHGTIDLVQIATATARRASRLRALFGGSIAYGNLFLFREEIMRMSFASKNIMIWA